MFDMDELPEGLTDEERMVLKKALTKLMRTDGRFYTATEIGNELGISAKKIGIIARRNKVQTDHDSEYCFWTEERITHGNGKKQTFFSTSVCKYTNKGREAIIRLYRAEMEKSKGRKEDQYET